MKMKSIAIENYRAFEKFEVSFDDKLTVFVGANGSGKSTVLDAVAMLLQKFFRNAGGNRSAIGFDNISWTNVNIHQSQQKIKFRGYLGVNQQKYLLDVAFSRQVNDEFQAPAAHGHMITELIAGESAEIKEQGHTLFVYYGSKRILSENSVHLQKRPQATLDSAFAHATDVSIDFASSLAWFDTKDAEEARYALNTQNLTYKIPELQAVRDAITNALGDYENPRMMGTPAELVVYKKGEPATPYSIMQLSDGYRTMLALIMDLARRMAVANSAAYAQTGKSVLESPAIVLIDEVELHLHPGWQQSVLPSLQHIFPNAQFIVSTHSPQVLTSIEPQHIRLLRDGKAEEVHSSSYGAESSRVLEDILKVNPRPVKSEAKKTLDSYLQLVAENKYDSKEAQDYRKQLDEWLAGDPILDHADMVIQRAERKKAQEAKRA